MELLEDRLGTTTTSVFNIKVLELSNCKLTSLGNLLTDDYFIGLKELVLDNNNISDVRGSHIFINDQISFRYWSIIEISNFKAELQQNRNWNT